MPVNLSKQNLTLVHQKNYFMTEKSDGVRYFLYVVNETTAGQCHPDPVAVLVDRSLLYPFIHPIHSYTPLYTLYTHTPLYTPYTLIHPFLHPITAFNDRAKNVFKFRGSKEVGLSLGLGTVIDGELVFNR